MGLSKTIWAKPAEYLGHQQPENPVLFFAPGVLHDTARLFVDSFPGLVTYAVKSNPQEVVIANLAAAGLRGFDVASPAEMLMIRRLAPEAVMHYNNPVRARSEIAVGVALGVKSWAVDSRSELAKLVEMVPAAGCEISVRFTLPVAGAACNFGARFGAAPDLAADLLRVVGQAGFTPSLTFHPGTHGESADAWESHIQAAAEIAAAAGVRIARLNVGGGFPGHRKTAARPDLPAIFARIDAATGAAFGVDRPSLVCEPGRAMVAESLTLAARVKAVRDGAHVFLNDGTHGTLDELPVIGVIDRTEVLTPRGTRRTGPASGRTVFGPTCDPVDRLPGELMLPDDIAEGDYVLFHGLGACSIATNTRFDGFGEVTMETVLALR